MTQDTNSINEKHLNAGDSIMNELNGLEQPEGDISLQTICMPADTNYMGDIFGGWLMSQMDIAGAIAAGKHSGGRVTTIAIKDMTFHVPVFVGDVITCYTSVKRIGNTSITIDVEAWVTRNHASTQIKVTEGVFVFVAIDQNRQKRLVPKT